MVDLDWHEFLEIGVDFIDEDHRGLLKIVRQVKSAVLEKNYNETQKLLDILINDASLHFEKEEQYLKEVKYPELESHIAYHKKLLMKAEAARIICEDLDSDNRLEDCLESLAKFLIDDILRGDIAFKSYLEYEGYIES